MTNCPHCKKSFTQVRIVPVAGAATNGTRWKCVSYNCPNCASSLSVQVDPTAISAEIIAAIKRH